MRARDNPFATTRVHQLRYRLRGRTWDELMQRLGEMKYRAAIVGREGSGKTTLLEDFAPRLREQGFEIVLLRLTREVRTFDCHLLRKLFASATPQHAILFDGSERMNRWAWLHFRWGTRRAGGLIVTAHQRGLLPTLLECRPTADLLAELIADLSGRTAESERIHATELFSKHRGNLRDALRELYDRWAALPEYAAVCS